jgi:hypothetical protein
MPGASIPPTLTFAGFPAGVNNVASEEAMPTDEFGRQTSARAAANVDFDASGKPRRRTGYALISAMAGMHSLWAHPSFPWMLAVHDNERVLVDANMEVSTAGVELYDGRSPMSYALIAGAVYHCNGHDSGQIMDDGSLRSWAPEHPSGQPTLTLAPLGGGMDAGTYQVAVTFIDSYGRESGAYLPAEIELEEGEGIRLTDFPEAQDPTTQWVRVYCSKPNGDMLYAVQDIPVGMSTFILGVHTPGKELDRLFLEPMPAGDIVRGHAGRQFVADRGVLMWSPTLMYGLLHRATSTMSFRDQITLIEPAGQAQNAGLYVSTAKATYFLSSPDPKDWQRSLAYPHGAVAGSSLHVDAAALGLNIEGTVPVWLATNGQFVVGLPGGKIQPMHDGRYVAPISADSASLAVRERDGARHIVAAARGGSTSGLRATDVVDAQVWKHGVRIS